MMDYRHCAYNIGTGEIINTERGNQLKRAVADTNRYDRHFGNVPCSWHFSHDYGKKWETDGLPSH